MKVYLNSLGQGLTSPVEVEIPDASDGESEPGLVILAVDNCHTPTPSAITTIANHRPHERILQANGEVLV